MKQKALRAGDAHSHEDEECRKRLCSARECAKAHSFFVYTMSQVQICACTRICIWRMYIIELLSEMVYKVYKSSRSQPARLDTMSQVQAKHCRRQLFSRWIR